MSGIGDLVTKISGGRAPDDNKLELIAELKKKSGKLTFDCEFSNTEKGEQDPQKKRRLRVWYFKPGSVGSKEGDRKVWFEAEGPSDTNLRRQALKHWEKVTKPVPKDAAATTTTTTASKQPSKTNNDQK